MHSVKSDYIFVYSSLLHGFPTTDYEYVSRYFNFVSAAKTKGTLSILDNIVVGKATEEEKFIEGELYEIKDSNHFSFAIGQLDEYEGVHPEPPQQPRYKRELTTVVAENNENYTAWVYWYTGNVEGLSTISSGSVLDFLNREKDSD